MIPEFRQFASVQTHFEAEEMPIAEVKRKTRPVRLYELNRLR
ncbi:MAG TPA: hypothetical protein PKO06_01525 [Candidatus Ozemobacteraceae bacterium]|nr:hypothetical protein [Candidatus Ozemobacteraceae bacterium]